MEKERLRHDIKTDSWLSWCVAQEKRIQLAEANGDEPQVAALRGDYSSQLEAYQASLELKCLVPVRAIFEDEHIDSAGHELPAASQNRALPDNSERIRELLPKAQGLRTFGADEYLIIGQALDRVGRTDEGLDSIDKALQLRPNFGGGHTTPGVLLAPLGRFEEALAAHEEARKHWPDLVLAQNNRGIMLQRLERF